MKQITVLPILLVFTLLTSCVSTHRELTYPQRLYAVQSEYIIVADMAADYIEQPDANPNVKAAVKRINRQVVQALKRARESEDYAPAAIGIVRYAILSLKKEMEG